MQKGNVGWYEKSGSGQYVQFFADGHASMTDKITGTEMEYFDTVKECLEFLWKKYMPFIEEGTINDLVALITSRPLSWL
jgi:peroxiredoxin